ncbi:MAG: transglutaminase family protein [Proteobacteria bacterium]|nr:transglutaminase family protein [Pseudomonadota bacterium]
MRIQISHETVYRYAEPAGGVIQILRLTPRSHDGQFVVDWRLEVSQDCRLSEAQDAFGNIVHTFSADGPFAELRVAVEGAVETQDTGGIVHGAIERFPPSLYLRATDLTRPNSAIAAFAREAAGEGETLARMHRLLGAINRDIVFDTDPTHSATKAVEAFALRRGVCQDLTHIMLACARSLGLPARYIGGYIHRVDGVVDQDAGHAWCEIHVPDLGWVAFDPANGICAMEGHVRVAAGLDYLGAAPVRGARNGGGGETLTVAVSVSQSARQEQN